MKLIHPNHLRINPHINGNNGYFVVSEALSPIA